MCMLSHVRLFCDPMDCSPPGYSVHGVSQARILEQDAISSSRGSSWPSNQNHVSCISFIGKRSLYHWTTWDTLVLSALSQWWNLFILSPTFIFYLTLVNKHMVILSSKMGLQDFPWPCTHFCQNTYQNYHYIRATWWPYDSPTILFL